ncbi:MAG: dTDP-glucose 4,6-dehydratase [Chthonomonas sp.]|nr:dTDP-glucose 4,6-dehydratase [Chthonomonas sp.]
MRILVTGGSGFIGSAFLSRFVPENPHHEFLNIDKLSYAAHPLNTQALEQLPNYCFERVDLAHFASVQRALKKFAPDRVFHFAAETHVDRSIRMPLEFVQSNVLGTVNLLEACRQFWDGDQSPVFLSVSTDEVFGSLGDSGAFSEMTPYDPHSPYSASKASADHFCRAYHDTFGLPVKITNCSNNYGPRQFPEKLIPLMILNAMEDKPLPVYGEGLNVRDWLFVDDHCEALWQVAERGKLGETYCIGGGHDVPNIEIVKGITKLMAERRGLDSLDHLITFVKDRPGHDFRYAIDTSKIKNELGWQPSCTFEEGLALTIDWYMSNEEWVRQVRTGEYQNWIDSHYGVAH